MTSEPNESSQPVDPYQLQIQDVFRILEDWYQAVEDGSVEYRLPDPNYQSPAGRPTLTPELVNEFIRELDREMDMDAFGVQGRKYGADASCEFHRLAYPQRLALVQQLMDLVHSDREIREQLESNEEKREAA